MPQTFYIENDEEIISVIGRLRKSSDQENYFVFPKRALVLQSIINLRLFQREAEKLGKNIVIVTQDDAGKMLAEKAGLRTESYVDDFSRRTNHLELMPSEVARQKKSIEPVIRAEQNHLHSKDVGSSDFYAAASAPQPLVAAQPEIQALRVRNASPEKQTSLNSKREPTEIVPTKRPVATMPFYPKVSMPIVADMSQPAQVRMPEQLSGSAQDGREARLKNFFTQNATTPKAKEIMTPVGPPQASAPETPVASGKAAKIFLFLGGVSLVSLVGVAVFLFLPKAEVHVVPYKTTQNLDLQFDGQSEAGTEEGNVVSVRFVEKERAVTVSAEATGTSLGTTQKARGTVTISNKNSAEPQSLVATTRFETGDGKIFRLTEGVTVPGMNGGQAGVIEASVIADQTGSEYNIGATVLTIPGFKSGPKYEKFSVQSTKAFSGGSDGNGADQTVISKNDLEKIELVAKERAVEDFLTATTGELVSGERMLKENLDVVAKGDATLPLSGTPATSFEYKATFTIRGFIFSEQTIKEKITTEGQTTVANVLFRPTIIDLSYGEATPDYDKKTVRLKIHAVVTAESVIDRAKLLTAMLGKDESGINTLLESFPEIKKVEIIFKPQWFTSTIPSVQDRVTIVVEPGEE